MKPLLKRLNRHMADRLGVMIARPAGLYPWQLEDRRLGAQQGSVASPEAAERLRSDHPRLAELRSRYAKMDPAVTTPLRWTESRLPPEDFLDFRGDNAFVWQMRRLNQNPLTYALCYYFTKSEDQAGLLTRLSEDGAFGARHLTIDGRVVSRDLLDSVREIEFLVRHAGLGERSRTVLDIGAGYGRLPFRLHQAFGGAVRSFATDAFAPSTFISEYYLEYRGASSAAVVALDEVERLLAETRIDIATNIHSFSECTLEAATWWIERVTRAGIRYFMIVPNEGRTGGSRCDTEDGRPIEPVLEAAGYERIAREPRYRDSLVQQYGIDPVHLHLFELKTVRG